nr:ParA family protein [Deltaproteobacteria bacterium]
MVDHTQRAQRPLRLIAVSGSKGGVGKSLLAANLGLYLATIGRRVVVVDADPCGATLHN